MVFGCEENGKARQVSGRPLIDGVRRLEGVDVSVGLPCLVCLRGEAGTHDDAHYLADGLD